MLRMGACTHTLSISLLADLLARHAGTHACNDLHDTRWGVFFQYPSNYPMARIDNTSVGCSMSAVYLGNCTYLGSYGHHGR